MSTREDDIEDLLDADALSPDDVIKLEAALGKLDALGDLDLAFRVRIALFFDYEDEDKRVAVFAWMIAKYQRQPNRFDEYADNLAYMFRFVLEYFETRPQQYSLEQILELLDQMEAFYRRFGFNFAHVYRERLKAADGLGDLKSMKKYYALWQRHRQADDDMVCPEHEDAIRVYYWLYLNEPKKALAFADRFLTGDEECGCSGSGIRSAMLRCLVAAGRREEAAALFRRECRKADVGCWEAGNFLAYLRHAGSFTRGITLLEKHLESALEETDASSRLRFFRAVGCFLDRLGDTKAVISLRPPKTFPLHCPSGKYRISVLRDWAHSLADEAGGHYDRRNGNTVFSNMMLPQVCY